MVSLTSIIGEAKVGNPSALNRAPGIYQSPGSGTPWTPASVGSLRAWYYRDGKQDGAAGAVTNTEDIATWLDSTGTYNATTVLTDNPTGRLTTGGPVVANFNGSQAIRTPNMAIPDDVVCTVGFLARVPAVNISARDFDMVLCFADNSASNTQLGFCLRRVSTQLRWGFAAQFGGSFSGWTGDTVLSTSAWSRVIYTLDGSAMTITVDGIPQTITQTNVGTPTAGQWLSNATSCNNITIGARNWLSGTAENWTNDIDEIAWFNEVLTGGNFNNFDSYLADLATDINE